MKNPLKFRVLPWGLNPGPQAKTAKQALARLSARQRQKP